MVPGGEKNKKGGAIWQYLRMDTEGYESLTLTRLIRTKKGEEVGVLVVYIRPGYLTEILGTGGSDVMLVLNGETMVAKKDGKHGRFCGHLRAVAGAGR